MTSENSDSPCDTGSDLNAIASAFPELDFSNVDPIFPSKSPGTPYEFSRAATRARGEACLRDLKESEDKVIIVVSHSAFLRTAICRRRFANGDYRIFTFAKDENGAMELREEDETELKGGGMGRSELGVFLLQDWDFPPENVEEVT